jgi:Flp pilus assembly pilin Flp
MWTKLNQLALSLVTRAQLHREDGQALVEYSLILALISVVAIGVMVTVGGDVEKVFSKIGEELGKAL